MKIALITNLNGRGLHKDSQLIWNYLQSKGHEAYCVQYDGPTETLQYDLAIFLEVIPRNFIEIAPVRWAILNPEWCKPDVIKMGHRHIHKIFAKTREAFRVLSAEFGRDKVFYTGMLTEDRYLPGHSRFNTFLHIGGNSQVRGTQEVIDAWMWKKNGKQIEEDLIIVSSVVTPPQDPRISHHLDLDDTALRVIQNKCRYHIYPTQTEGYGHALHEAISVGAVVLATNAPPMNEMGMFHGIPSHRKSKLYLAELYETSALDIYDIVQNAIVLCGQTGDEAEYLKACRAQFKLFNENFDRDFSMHLHELSKPSTRQTVKVKKSGLEIAFLGNFKATESTENMVWWALTEGLGHEVIQLQENEVNIAAIRSACENADAFLWCRTPDWLRVREDVMGFFLGDLKIPSISIHLDKFWGIPKREELIGKLSFWKTAHVWTADGSRDADFKARGVNHHWMKPAVSETYCHPGRPWDMYRCDVGFVGARAYHEEYPFRQELVEWLERTYAGRFQHITDLRGHGLNDFYASCRVTIGDCIFAGTPRYWSDRAPETCGRYGFLLHPLVEGLTLPIAYYKPGSLESLQHQIENCLTLSQQRWNAMRYNAAQEVKLNHTWTVRVRSILEESL